VAQPDGADVWPEIPDIGPLDWSGDNEQRRLWAGASIIAKPPIIPAGKSPMRRFDRIKSDSTLCMSLRAAHEIKCRKLDLS
jgi:hypothetical protein